MTQPETQTALVPFGLPDIETQALGILDELWTRRESTRANLQRVSQAAQDLGAEQLLEFFQRGQAAGKEGYFPEIHAPGLFDLEPAVRALDASLWRELFAHTDLLDLLPQDDRQAWKASLEALNIPPFEPTAVRETLLAQISLRPTYLAKRVDGIFQNLSGDHITNSPKGFGMRFILGYLRDSFGYFTSRTGYIHDLRSVIARFLGLPEPSKASLDPILQLALTYYRGQWVDMDGGAFRIRLYNKGTAHIEVCPQIARRLNGILAFLYPLAIPAAHRTREPLRRNHTLFQRPLPNQVVELLQNLFKPSPFVREIQTWGLSADARTPATLEELRRILTAIGATVDGLKVTFPYDPEPVIAHLVVTRTMPDQKTHQYYPTPPELAEEVIRCAEIGPSHQCLEPSAGQGALASLLPADRTVCVEVSALHARILRAQGIKVEETDFLDWARFKGPFDRIVMNPPFSEGRWQAHLRAALPLLTPNGRLVAVLPSGARNLTLPGHSVTCSSTFEHAFPGTSVNTVIVVITPAA